MDLTDGLSVSKIVGHTRKLEQYNKVKDEQNFDTHREQVSLLIGGINKTTGSMCLFLILNVAKIVRCRSPLLMPEKFRSRVFQTLLDHPTSTAAGADRPLYLLYVPRGR